MQQNEGEASLHNFLCKRMIRVVWCTEPLSLSLLQPLMLRNDGSVAEIWQHNFALVSVVINTLPHLTKLYGILHFYEVI